MGRTRTALPKPLDELRQERSWPSDIPLPPAGAYKGDSRWSAEDEDLLRQFYPLYGARYAARLLGRSQRAIMHHAMTLGIRKHKVTRPWTKKEDQFLRRHYHARGGDYLAESLGRSLSAVRHRALRLGIAATVPKWSADDLSLLRKHFGRMPLEKLAHMLGRPADFVDLKARNLGLRPFRVTSWSEQELDELRRLAGTMTYAEIGKRLGRPTKAVGAMASRLGITKPMTVITPAIERMIVRKAGRVSLHALAEELGISWARIVRIVREHGIDTSVRWWRNPWREEEDAYVRNHYHDQSVTEIGQALGRSSGAVSHRMTVLGIAANERQFARTEHWTAKQDALLGKHFETMTTEELAVEVGRTPDAVRHRLHVLKLRRGAARGTMRRWTAKEDAAMRLLYHKHGARKMAERLGRSADAIRSRARTLGLTAPASITIQND